jgi:hypothetical protein
MRRPRLLVPALGAFMFSAVLWGQGTAQFSGRLTDPSGSVIPGAAVTLTNTDTGLKWETTADDLGYYAFPTLPPGSYAVSARREGFRTVTRAGSYTKPASNGLSISRCPSVRWRKPSA